MVVTGCQAVSILFLSAMTFFEFFATPAGARLIPPYFWELVWKIFDRANSNGFKGGGNQHRDPCRKGNVVLLGNTLGAFNKARVQSQID